MLPAESASLPELADAEHHRRSTCSSPVILLFLTSCYSPVPEIGIPRFQWFSPAVFFARVRTLREGYFCTPELRWIAHETGAIRR
jgi:hypothetical protein